MPAVFECVFVHHSACEEKPRGRPEARKANLSGPQQHTPLSINASPPILAFHPIDPISWQSDLHLMQQQLCVVVSVSVPFVCLCFLNQTLRLYPLSKTLSLSLFSDSFFTLHPTLFWHPFPAPSFSPSIYALLCYASSLSSVQSRQTHHYPSM